MDAITLIRRAAVACTVLGLAACRGGGDDAEVHLETRRIPAAEAQQWSAPAIESGGPQIVVRQVFTALGPCRTLRADLIRRYPSEYLLRVMAGEEPHPCGDATPHIAYTAVLRGLSPGSYGLRVVHVGSDGSTLSSVVLEHPIVVTDGS